jgi:hypothetical protein
VKFLGQVLRLWAIGMLLGFLLAVLVTLTSCAPPTPPTVTACQFRYRDWHSATAWTDVYRCGTELRRIPSAPVRDS